MLRRLFGGSRFLKKLNPLLELYSYSKDTKNTYQELLALKPLAKTRGERALFELNRAALLKRSRGRSAGDSVPESGNGFKDCGIKNKN